MFVGSAIFSSYMRVEAISWLKPVLYNRSSENAIETSRYGYGQVVDNNGEITCLAHIEERIAVRI